MVSDVSRCQHCGYPNPTAAHVCVDGGFATNHQYGRYEFTPNHLTEADIRRIVREELDRAKGKP